MVSGISLEMSSPPPPATIPDLDAPEITLVGPSSVALEVFSSYTEWGAKAVDLRDGRVAAKVVSGSVNTSAVTSAGQPIRVMYEAIDSAGNVARRQRLVTVYDSCNATGEVRCADTLQCSVRRICGSATEKAGAITAVASKTQQTAVSRPPDTVPPVVVVSGPGVPYATPNGTSGMITTVYVGDTYTDAGATATDEVPAASGAASTFVKVNVMSSILSPAGRIVTAVSTVSPTGNDTSTSLPYLITYSAVDGAGNTAASVRRRVYVLCRAPEFACAGDLPSDPLTCSSGGICGMTTTVNSNRMANSGNSTNGNGTQIDTLPGGSSSDSDTASMLIPRFILNSDPIVTIAQGSTYAVCRDGMMTDCEPGGTATLKTQGDMNGLLRACAAGVRDPQPFEVVGLQYCNINTRVPGNYTISFHLTWPSVGEIIVYRYLVVQAQCEGERVCSDGRCSTDLVCASELGLASTAGQNANGTADGADRQGSVVSFTNTAPRLTLSVSDVVGSQVEVKRGVAYKVCTSAQSPTEDRPCEPLGAATDMEDGDLTSRIALCPPADCAKTQCRAHWADRKQPSECGVDTVTGAVGTTYRLQIVAFDSKGANATAERAIKVVSPCFANQSYCEEALASGGTRFVCSDISCEERAGLAAATGAGVTDVAMPRLFVLPGSHADNLTEAETAQTMFVAYGQAAPVSLAPCANFSEGLPPQLASCAAIANDTTDGDVTPDIIDFVAPLCPAISESGDNGDENSSSSSSCSSCSIAGLTTGVCLPGRYRITYTVAGSGGSVSTSRTLDVWVEQRTNTVIDMNLFPNRTAAGSINGTLADTFAANLTANATMRYAVLQPILQAFGVTPESIRSLTFSKQPEVSMVAAADPTQPAYYVVKMTVNVTTGHSDFLDASGVVPVGSLSASRRRRSRSLADGPLLALPDSTGSPAAGPGSIDGSDFTTSPFVGPQVQVVSLLPIGDEQATLAYLSPSAGAAPGLGRAAGGGIDRDRGEPAEPHHDVGPRAILLHALASLLGRQVTDADTSANGVAARRVALASGASSASEASSDPLVPPGAPIGLAARLHDVEAQMQLAVELMQAQQGGSESISAGEAQRRRLGGALPGYAAAAAAARRALQGSSCNTSAISTPSASSAAAVGLESVGTVETVCATPAVLPSTAALSMLLGAVSDLDRLSDEVAEQQASMISLVGSLDAVFSAKDLVYKLELKALSNVASAAFKSMSAKAQTAMLLLNGTQAVQAASATILNTTLGLMQSALNEVEASTKRFIYDTEAILDAIGNTANVTAEEYAAYASCLFIRGQEASFAFRASHQNVGNASFYQASAAALAAAGRRRQLLLKLAPGTPLTNMPSVTSMRMQQQGQRGQALLWEELPVAAESTAQTWLLRFYDAIVGVGKHLWSPWAGESRECDGMSAACSSQSGGGTPQAALNPRYMLEREARAAGVEERSLLSGGGGGSGGNNNGSARGGAYERFEGYSLPSGDGFDYSLWEVRNKDRNRLAGLNNKILVGLLLHQVRRSVAEIRSTTGIDGRICRKTDFDSLVVGCDTTKSKDNRTPASGDLGGIGNDPVFNRHSALYNTDVEPTDYYNLTMGSPERNAAGVPYGFFHEPIERLPPGYPLLFDTRLSAQRAEQAITFVRDGSYLSSTFTKSLRAQLVTYNPDAQVFGYWRVDFSWSDSGVIDAKTYLMGLPAISYGDAITNLHVSQFLPDFFLVLLIIGYFGMTTYDIYCQLQNQRLHRRILWRRAVRKASEAFKIGGNSKGRSRVLPWEVDDPVQGSDSDDSDGDDRKGKKAAGRGRRKFKPRMSALWVLYEVTVCALMAAAIAVFYSYAVRLSVRDDFTSRFDVYDADSFAPARYFLTRRDDVSVVNGSSVSTNTSASSVPKAGDAGRWALPADRGPLNDAAAMFARVDSMYNTLVTYTFLQGLVLAMVVLRWLHYISFQPRLSILVGTLARALPDLLHFALVVILCVVLFAAAAALVFGTEVAELSSMSEATYLMLRYVLLRDNGHVFQGLLNNSVEKSGVQWALAGLLYVLGPIFFVLVLARFILAFLVWPFAELKFAVAGQPGVPQDVGKMVTWMWQRLRWKAPKNRQMLSWLEAWLAGSGRPGVLQLLHRSVANFRAALSAIAPSRKNLGGASHISMASVAALRNLASRPVSAAREAVQQRPKSAPTGGPPLPGAASSRNVLRFDGAGRPLDGKAISAALHAVSRAKLQVGASAAAAGADVGPDDSIRSGGKATSGGDKRPSGHGEAQPEEKVGAAAAAGGPEQLSSPFAVPRRSTDAGGRTTSGSVASRGSGAGGGAAAAAAASSPPRAAQQQGEGEERASGSVRRGPALGMGLGLGGVLGSRKALFQGPSSRLGLLGATPVQKLQPPPSDADAEALAETVMANLLSRFGHPAGGAGAGAAGVGAAPTSDAAAMAGGTGGSGVLPAGSPTGASGADRPQSGGARRHSEGDGSGRPGGAHLSYPNSAKSLHPHRASGDDTWAVRMPASASRQSSRPTTASHDGRVRSPPTATARDGAPAAVGTAGGGGAEPRSPRPHDGLAAELDTLRAASVRDLNPPSGAGGPLAARPPSARHKGSPQEGSTAARQSRFAASASTHASPAKSTSMGGEANGVSASGSISGSASRKSVTAIPLPPLPRRTATIGDASAIPVVPLPPPPPAAAAAHEPRKVQPRPSAARGRDPDEAAAPQPGQPHAAEGSKSRRSIVVKTLGQATPNGASAAPAATVSVVLGLQAPRRGSTGKAGATQGQAASGAAAAGHGQSREAARPPPGQEPERLIEQLQDHEATEACAGGSTGTGAEGASSLGQASQGPAPLGSGHYKAWPSMRVHDSSPVLPLHSSPPQQLAWGKGGAGSPASAAAPQQQAAAPSAARSRRKLEFAPEVLIEEEGEEELEEEPSRFSNGSGPRSSANLHAGAAGAAGGRSSRQGSSGSGPGPVAEALEGAAASDADPGTPNASSVPRLRAQSQALPPLQRLETHDAEVAEAAELSPEAALLSHLLAGVRALTAHLNAMLAQLLAAGREVEEMVELLSDMLAAAAKYSPDRSAMRAALRGVVRQYVAEHRIRLDGRARELERPLPELELPSPAVLGQRLQARAQAAAQATALVATLGAIARAPTMPLALRLAQSFSVPLAAMLAAEEERQQLAEVVERELSTRFARAPEALPSAVRRLADEVADQVVRRESQARMGALIALAAAASGGSITARPGSGRAAGYGDGGGGGGSAEAAAALASREASVTAPRVLRRGWGFRRRAMAAAEVRQAEKEQQDVLLAALEGRAGSATGLLADRVLSVSVSGGGGAHRVGSLTAGLARRQRSVSRLRPRVTLAPDSPRRSGSVPAAVPGSGQPQRKSSLRPSVTAAAASAHSFSEVVQFAPPEVVAIGGGAGGSPARDGAGANTGV